LSAAGQAQIPPVLAGFDGFVDTILHVVSERRSPSDYSRLTTLSAFSERILEAYDGRNTNIEMVPRLTKIGGNGPIFAFALARFGIPVSYIGCLGLPEIHPVFEEFSRSVNAFSIAEPGYSDAIEFVDAKLICGKQQSVSEISWQSIRDRLPIDQLAELVANAGLVAFLDWALVFQMTDIVNEFLSQVASRLSGPKKPLFVDTADFSKRSDRDILGFANVLRRLGEKFQVYVGFNLRESALFGRVVGLKEPEKAPTEVLKYSQQLRAQVGVDTLLIHWSQFAAAVDRESAVWVETPFTTNPRISTGAGDHFNAGFCLGRLLGADLATNLKLGVAASGYYVREAESPTLRQLARFIETLSYEEKIVSR
jgi:sugar/nucleoside kinase (ribokinase family)